MAYIELSHFQRVLQKPNPTSDELEQMERCLEAAAADIDWDLGYTTEDPAPSPEHPILADVNLDRALELWKLNQGAGAGALPGVGPEGLPLIAPRDTWYRYHLRLRPLWTRFGVA